jgi:hypothetical protein
MAGKSIAEKMQIKPGEKILLLDAPEGYAEMLGKLPEKAAIVPALENDLDVIQIFTAKQAELEKHLPELRKLLKADGKLWVSYPKGTSRKYQSEINRDSIAAYAISVGLQPVRQIAIDEDWSALRFKIV